MSGHKLSQKEEIPDAGMKNAVFLNNLEEWIDEIISQDGLADKELIRTIKERYERSIQANIDHYNYLAKNAKENDDIEQEDRHRLMVRVYQELLPNKSTIL
jgi:low affinity Fe/Cu permease